MSSDVSITKGEVGTLAPLSFLTGTLKLDEDFRKKIVKTIDIQESNSRIDSLAESDGAWTGDVADAANLHQDENLNTFFKKVYLAVGHYLADVGINPAVFHFEVVRAWGTKTDIGRKIHQHSHSYCSLSLVYYPYKSDTKLYLTVENHPNEVVPGLVVEESYGNGILNPDNPNIANTVGIIPEDDMFVVFPAATIHYTDKSEDVEPRYSIAVDVFLTLKDSTNVEANMPPKEVWRRLEDF